MLEVAEQRPLEVTWRLISLAVLNGGTDSEPARTAYQPMIRTGTEIMRVLAATRELGNAQLGELYTCLGIRIHDKGRGSELFGPDATEDLHLELLSESLVAAGLPAELLEASGNPAYDASVRSETTEALARTGDDVGTPIITFDPDNPEQTSFFGPVLNRIPRGDEAVELFDLVGKLVTTPGLSEIKRSLRGAPEFG